MTMKVFAIFLIDFENILPHASGPLESKHFCNCVSFLDQPPGAVAKPI